MIESIIALLGYLYMAAVLSRGVRIITLIAEGSQALDEKKKKQKGDWDD